MGKGTKCIREYFDYCVTLQPCRKITQIACDAIGSGAVVTANGFYDFELYNETQKCSISRPPGEIDPR